MSWNARRAVLADTGPLYAAADATDQYHARARTELQGLAAEGFGVVVVRTTLLKAHSLALHRLGPRRDAVWLESVLAGAFIIDPTTDDHVEALRRLRRFPDQPVSLFDATLAAVSDRLGRPVWTFDHHFDVMRIPVWR